MTLKRGDTVESNKRRPGDIREGETLWVGTESPLSSHERWVRRVPSERDPSHGLSHLKSQESPTIVRTDVGQSRPTLPRTLDRTEGDGVLVGGTECVSQSSGTPSRTPCRPLLTR